jgi:putative pyruvate formate lyase activating enzyme
LGYCRAPAKLVVANWGPHFGEESCLVGVGGSGTVFLAGCNLRCVFCQNHDLSHQVHGSRWNVEDLVYAMLRLADGGCENINFVTPSHYAAPIAEAIAAARARGLAVPVVYNCGGYESVETLQLMAGLIDIYMPDFKFWSEDSGRRYAEAPDYALRAREALQEMHRQVGDLVIDHEVARRGLLVRHLVMPEGLEEGRAILDFLAAEISPRTFVNIMDQYRPLYRAIEFAEINRRPTTDEIVLLASHAVSLGLRLAD